MDKDAGLKNSFLRQNSSNLDTTSQSPFSNKDDILIRTKPSILYNRNSPALNSSKTKFPDLAKDIVQKSTNDGSLLVTKSYSDGTKSEKIDKKKQIQELLNYLAAMEKENHQLDDVCKDLQKKNYEKICEISNAETRLKKSLEKQYLVQEKEKRLIETENKFAYVERENSSLKSQIEIAKNEMNQLQSQIERDRKRREEMQQVERDRERERERNVRRMNENDPSSNPFGYIMNRLNNLSELTSLFEASIIRGGTGGEALRSIKTGFSEELINKIPTISYSKYSPNSNQFFDKCLVCQEDFEEYDILRKLNCTHQYHRECIDPWLKDNKTCPTCKAEVRIR